MKLEYLFCRTHQSEKTCLMSSEGDEAENYIEVAKKIADSIYEKHPEITDTQSVRITIKY